MKTFEEAAAYIKAETNLANEDVHFHFTHLKLKFSDFLTKLEQEDEQAKAAFRLVVDAALHNRTLTYEEKLEVETQLKEVLKTADLIALTILPGGTVVLVLAGFLKLNSYILPSVFLSKP